MDSPYTSLKSLEEGKSYIEYGLSPYFESSPVHSPPILLSFYILTSKPFFYIILSLMELHSAYLIKHLTKSPISCLLFYLNPFSLYMNLNLSTSILNIWVLLLFVLFCLNDMPIRAAYFLSLVIYLDPSLGIISSFWYFRNKSLKVYLYCLAFLIQLKLASDLIAGDGWINSCQFSSFFMYDIKPNFGLRWYLMLEMFKRYYSMYSVMVAVHTWVYVYPLFSILGKFQRYAKYEKIMELYLGITLAIVYINHPHPTFFEYSFVISFFIMHKDLVLQVKSAFFTVCSWVIGNILSVFMWKIWIERMGGNANFFYFQTVFTNYVAIGFVVALLYQIVENTKKAKVKKLCSDIVRDLVNT